MPAPPADKLSRNEKALLSQFWTLDKIPPELIAEIVRQRKIWEKIAPGPLPPHAWLQLIARFHKEEAKPAPRKTAKKKEAAAA